MTISTPLRVFYAHMGYMAELPSLIGATSSPDTLPPFTIVAPGAYTIGGQVINCQQEGLYRVTNFAGFTSQFIVYAQDLDALLSSICRLHQQGSIDGSPTPAQLVSIVRTRRAVVTCGILATFAVFVLQGAGFQARVANLLSAGPYNGYDDGHILVEIMLNGKWVAYDPDMQNDFWFVGTGPAQRASVLDIHYGIASGVVVPRSLTMPTELGPDPEFSAAFLSENIATLSGQLAWYTRMARVPYFVNGNGEQFLADNASDAAAAISYNPNFVQLAAATYVSTYYSTQTGKSPNSTTAWGTNTFVDRSLVLTPGANIKSLGLYFNNPQSGLKMKIMQELSPTSFNDVAETSPQNHPGSGYADFALSFVVPATGVYRIGAYCSVIGVEAFSTIGNRSSVPGDQTGSGITMVNHADGTICTRWTSV